MDFVKQIINLISMPVAVLTLGLVGMALFRSPLSRLLDRTRRIGKTGLEADPQAQDSALQIKASAADELQRLFDNALLVQRETVIQAELERLAFRDTSDREKFLIRLLAAAVIIQQFERTYALVFGSQLGVLQFLNTMGAVGAPINVLQPWYDQAAGKEPAFYQNYTFDQWLSFLQTNQLLVRSEDTVTITLEGKEFLKYLLHQGYSPYKAG